MDTILAVKCFLKMDTDECLNSNRHKIVFNLKRDTT